MDGGIFDLPAPLFDLVDRVFAIALPDALRVVVYGALAGAVGLLIYARISPQKRLREFGDKQAALMIELVTEKQEDWWDVGGLVEKWLRVTWDRFVFMLLPAIVALLPMLFMMPWISDRFEAVTIAPGTEVCARPEPAGTLVTQLKWNGGDVAWDEARQCWRLRWPDLAHPLVLVEGSRELTRLPWPAPGRLIHTNESRARFAVNPAGYLPLMGSLNSLEIDEAARTLVPFVPRAIGGWEPLFFLAALASSVWLKIRRNVA